MINLEQKYTPRVNPGDADYPFGSIKGDSSPGAGDGTPLSSSWGNDIEGFRQAVMTEAGVTPSGQPDNAYTSQLWSAMKDVLRQEVPNMGWTPVEGSFEVGGTITERNQILWWEDGKAWYSWQGTIPLNGYVVAAGSTPAVAGGISPTTWVDRTDGSLRSELAADGGAGMIGFGDESVQSVITESLTPDSQGAAGDGVTDDTAGINSAISAVGSNVTLKKGKKYLTTSISNNLGKPFTGAGHVVESVTGGLEAQNTYADRYQRVTGQENLAAWYRLVYDQHTTPTRQMRIVFSGDSTTAGVGVDLEYQIASLVANGISDAGMQGPYNTSCINNGHSGAHTGQWETTYVYDDIADAPDLLVLRWGINDPGYLKDGNPAPLDAGQSYPNRRDINDFATSLRNGLTTFRASKNFYTTSILLMMPNSTYDIPNGRDALWYEHLRDVLIQAARDFQCAFIDTYAIMQDSRYLANVLMDDPMPTSGRGIHPNNTMNSIIAGHMLDVIMPKGLRYNLAANKILSIGGAALAVSASLLPSAYGAAVYMNRALTANGWPIDGNALTFRTVDDTVVQYCFGYKNSDRGVMKIRFGRAASIGGEPEDWSPWYNQVMDGGVIDVSPGAGFSQPASGKMKVAFSGTQAVFGGILNVTSPTTLTQNQIIGSISASIAPITVAFGTLTLFDGVTSFEQLPCQITPAGVIYLAKSSTVAPTIIQISLSFDNRI